MIQDNTAPSFTKSVLVIGGGVVGLASAYYLRRDGHDVTVIDQGQLAGGCSHGNCGYLSPSHVLPLTEPAALSLAAKSFFNPRSPFRVKPTLRPAMWRWMLQFARRCRHDRMLAAAAPMKAILDRSRSLYDSLIEDEAIDCHLNRRGLIFVMKSDVGMQSFAKTDQLLSDQFGVTARRLDGNALTEVEPALQSGLAGGYQYDCDFGVRPDRLCAGLVDRLRAAGVKLQPNCAMRSLSRQDGQLTAIHTDAGPLTADAYVFALGAWSPKWEQGLGFKIPIQPGKGYSLTMGRPEICPRHPMLFPEHKVGVSVFDDAFRLGSMMEFVGYDETIPPHRIEQLKSSAAEYLRQPWTEDVRETWYGWRPMTWDSLPIVGPAPGLGNTFLATGHNMLGLSMATGTGEMIAEMIGGRETTIGSDAFSPSRF